MTTKLSEIKGYDEVMPKSKQVRYESTKQQMDLKTGIVKTTEQNIFYDKEAEVFNSCRDQISGVGIWVDEDAITEIINTFFMEKLNNRKGIYPKDLINIICSNTARILRLEKGKE